MHNDSYIGDNGLDNKLVKVFSDFPYEEPRKDCTFYEMRGMALNEKLNFIRKMNDSNKIKK